VTDKQPGSEPFIGSELPESIFAEVRTLLLERRGFDLACYKDACIKRRIAARVRASGFGQPEPYLAVLRRDQGELDALMETLTIHVSQFFRNPSVFAFLKRSVLPQIVAMARAEGREEIRCWSVGCAGGEEAYSLALLLQEIPLGDCRVDILGTDVSPTALEQARRGVFPPQRVAEVPARMLERFFRREGESYRVASILREQMRFEQHDILSAPTFPAADLILCRNVLIYFSVREQEKIQQRFAAALSPHGFLALGRAETLMGGARRLFSIECSAERVYRSREKEEDAVPLDPVARHPVFAKGVD
jgi:chemotaxis protein methyltransferase CheR